jgi:hypothetical protein
LIKLYFIKNETEDKLFNFKITHAISMHGEETLWNILSNINEWIRFSDAKASILLAAYGAVGVLAFPEMTKRISTISSHSDLSVLMIIGLSFSVLAICFCFLTLLPRLRLKDIPSNFNSLIFFKDISERYTNWDVYYESVIKLIDEEDKIKKELSQQIHANSKVCFNKYVMVTRALWSTMFCFISFILFIILYLIDTNVI